jgi:hypothetical protein
MDDMHRLTTSIIILSLLSFPAFAVTDPGVEHPLSGITYAPPSGEQRPGSVASDGNDFVAVWSDITIPRQGVYATHIGAHGEAGISSQRLLRSGSARDLSLCYGSGGYLVTWTDDADKAVYSAKLNSDGNIVSGPRLIIPPDQGDTFIPAGTYARSLGCSSSGALLIFRKGGVPMVTLLDSNGNVTKAAKTFPINAGDPIVTVSDGSTYYIGTRSLDSQTVSVIRVSSNGDLIDSTPSQIIAGFTAIQIGMAYAGGRLGLAATNSTTLKRVFINPQSLAVTKLPDVASGGQEVNVVAVQNSLDAYLMNFNLSKLDILRVPLRDNETSAPTPTTALHSDALGSSVTVASNGRDSVAVWKDFRHSISAIDGDVFGAIVDSGNGAAGTPFPVAVTARWQGPVAIASSGSETFAVWEERIGDASQMSLVGARVDSKGALLDASPKQIAAAVAPAYAPAITWDGSTYIIAWTESSQTQFGLKTSVIVQRYGRDGATNGSVIRYDGPSGPALGSNGSSALLAFTYPDSRGLNVVQMQNPSAIMPLGVFGYGLSIGAAGSDYLVTWIEGAETCQIICFPDRRDISGIRVSGGGTILDATPIAIASGPKDQAFPHVASNGNDYLIVYDFQVDGVWTLAAKRVTHGGQLVDSLPNQDGVILANDVAPSAAVARDGGTYFVAYDAGNGTMDSTSLRVARLNDNGSVVDQSTGSLGNGTRSVPTFPALVKAGSGPVNLAYSRFATDSTFGGTMRAFLRFTPDNSLPQHRSRAAKH